MPTKVINRLTNLTIQTFILHSTLNIALSVPALAVNTKQIYMDKYGTYVVPQSYRYRNLQFIGTKIPEIHADLQSHAEAIRRQKNVMQVFVSRRYKFADCIFERLIGEGVYVVLYIHKPITREQAKVIAKGLEQQCKIDGIGSVDLEDGARKSLTESFKNRLSSAMPIQASIEFVYDEKLPSGVRKIVYSSGP